MPIGVTTLASGNLNSGSTTTQAVGTFLPTANRIIFISVQSIPVSISNNVEPTIPTSNGTNWEVVTSVETITSGAWGRVTLFRGMTASPTSANPTLTFSELQESMTWSAWEMDDVDTSGTYGSGAIVQSNTSGPTNSSAPATTLAAFGDATNNATIAIAGIADFPDDAQTIAANGGLTDIHDVVIQNTSEAYMCGINSAWVLGDDLAPDFTISGGSGNTDWGIIAVEVKVKPRDQEFFGFYDDGTEAAAATLAAQDTDITIADDTLFQLRVGMQATGDLPAESATLQYKETSDGAAEWRDVQ